MTPKAKERAESIGETEPEPEPTSEYESQLHDEQIDRIFKRCDYQKMMEERNWIGLDSRIICEIWPCV